MNNVHAGETPTSFELWIANGDAIQKYRNSEWRSQWMSQIEY